MSLLDETVRSQLRDILGQMPFEVELEFHPAEDQQTTEVMRSLLTEMSEAVSAIRVRESAAAPVVEPGHDTGMPLEGPVVSVRPAGGQGGRVRFLGLTVGLEFASLVEAIRQAGEGTSGLTAATRSALDDLPGPVHIQVFTTPNCPYCPQAVRLAHEMAFASEHVVADMVDASTYRALSDKYQVMGVPVQFFNGGLSQVGLAHEAAVLDLVRKAGAATKP